MSIMENEKVYIIAEIGVNHNGDIDIAKELIDAARLAGVDAVKFQSFNPEKTKIRSSPFAAYQEKNSQYKNSFEMSMKLMLSYDDHIILKEFCDNVNIDFLSTGFDNDSVDLLEKLGVRYHKIPSGEITNFPLIKHIASKHKPIIISTGMADLSEIDECVSYIKKYNSEEQIILHCISLYPTDFSKLNLNFITTLQTAFDAKIGFSDHSLGIEADIAAVTLGAKVIEKHITLDKNMPGPDHKASLNPGEMKQMVSAIRNIEKALGPKYKVLSTEELEMRKIARRSIVANADIMKGEKFTEEKLAIKKPGYGIPSKYLDIIIGRECTCNVKKDDILNWEMVGSPSKK